MTNKNPQPPPPPPPPPPDEPVVDSGVFREADRRNIELGSIQDSIPPPTVSATAPEPSPPRPPDAPPPGGGADEGTNQE